MKQPAHQPTAEQKALDAEVAKRRAALETEGHANEIERKDSIVPSLPDRVVSMADIMPDVLATFERMDAKAKTFFAEMRPKVEAAPQFIPCEIHDTGMRPIDFDLSCAATRAAEEFCAAYGDCPLCVKERARINSRRFWSRRGVPERVLEATFANYQTETEEQAEAVAKVKKWAARKGLFLVLLGSTGTGKGHLAAAALKVQGDGLWIEHVNMLADLRTSYDQKNTAELIERWQTAEMFVIDEFGLSAGGKDEEPMLYQVLADRYDKRRPTIITTNATADDFRQMIGFRLLDRIREDLTRVSMEWPSFRTNKPTA